MSPASDEDLKVVADLFGDVFAGASARGADLRVTLAVSEREACTGTRRTIEVGRPLLCEVCAGTGREATSPPCAACMGSRFVTNRHEGNASFIVTTLCSACRGRGHEERFDCNACHGGTIGRTERLDVVVPPAIEHGHELRAEGKGGELAGKPAGDLYVVLTIDKSLNRSASGSAYRGVTEGKDAHDQGRCVGPPRESASKGARRIASLIAFACIAVLLYAFSR